MIKIKVIVQDIETCSDCNYTTMLWLRKGLKQQNLCTITGKPACKTKISKNCPLLSRHDLLAKAKELYHQEKLERESNENS